MNKKILIYISIGLIGVVLIFIGILALTKPKNQPQTQNQTAIYSLTLSYYQNILTGSLSLDGTTTELNEAGLTKYAFISFNSPRDVMLAECSSGYSLTQPVSPSGNTIAIDPILGGVNMQLNTNDVNKLSFVCSKE